MTSVVVLVATVVALALFETASSKRDLVRNLELLADGMSQNIAFDVQFNRYDEVKKALPRLTADPRITAAAVYVGRSGLVAEYTRGEHERSFPVSLDSERLGFTGTLLVFSRPITLGTGQEPVGTILIRYSLEESRARMNHRIAMSLVILMLAISVAVILAAKCQQVIVRPILALATTAQRVATEKNYSLRAPSGAEDEVGGLIDSFNGMLHQIQQRDAELLDAREEAEKAREDAEKANRLKSKFLSVMSHELRTPLSIIIQFLDMVLPEVAAEQKTQWTDYLSRSLGQAHHMLNQINDILDIARIEAGKMEVSLRECEVSQIVEGGPMSGMPYLMRRNNNRLVVDCPPDLGKMWTDLDKVQRCLINLLGNASKFTKDGTVSLTVRREARDGRDSVRFRVQDTGKGMTEEELTKLFRPFSQASAAMGQQFGGHGLGLAITKELCQRLGGDVRAESELGKGSVFIMELPAMRPDGGASKEVASVAPAAGAKPASGGCILVIDDDPEMRRLLSEMLKREGFNVETAQGGEEGLRRARELRPAAITLDVLMPDMDGWTVLSSLKVDAKTASVPVVMISIWPESERAFALGVADYLSKPVDPIRLVSVLKKYHAPPPNNCALVVEDDPDMRSLLRQMLEAENWKATTAENGQEALEQIKQARPALIILDLMMPVMDGFQLLAELQMHPEWRRIPVVVVSAKDLTSDDKLRLEGRVIEVLKKGSFGREELMQTVQQTVRNLVSGAGSSEGSADDQSQKSVSNEEKPR
jgi:signal transduction histidine kinase/CheY-like chemotaxis protein